jgi:hypothetical protein
MMLVLTHLREEEPNVELYNNERVRLEVLDNVLDPRSRVTL